jgi:uncharacterized membrane protein
VKTSRLEAFSDAVLAIIITVMVLTLRVPAEEDFGSLLRTTGNGLLTYLLSFLYIAIYWFNHHRLFHLVGRIGAGVLWANLGLLFCLSLLPFTTAWMDHSRLAHTPLVLYGINLLLAGGAYFVLETTVLRQESPDSPLRQAIGRNMRGRISPLLYVAGILCAAIIDEHGRLGAWLALGCYALAAIIWVVPNRRIDRLFREHASAG